MRSDPDLIYHQRATLHRNIARYVRASGARSLLDIGAGWPAAALPIAALVDRYLGVESHSGRAEALRQAGLDIIAGGFPLEIDEQFDFLLSSHSIPENDIAKYPRFLSELISRARPGGTVLIVTFKGSEGELSWLSRNLLNEPAPACPERKVVESWFGRCGNCVTEAVNSYVETAAAESLAQFLWPWLTGRKELRERFCQAFLELIEARYFVRAGLYVFPTEHLFISHRRTMARQAQSEPWECCTV